MSVARAQIAAVQLAPAQPAAPELSDEEIEELREMYEGTPEEERPALVAMFKDMGIDLLALFAGDSGTPGAAGPGGDAAPPAENIVAAIQTLNFARTPATVLAARAALGLEATPMPDAEAPAAERAAWLHQHAVAGEWDAVRVFLSTLEADEADPIYAHILQSTNQGDPGLLPEEVLAISDAVPGELTDWQLDVLAQLLKSAASKSSVGPMLRQIQAGTTLFGAGDDEQRARTAKFLSLAGLPLSARDYLPPIDAARADGNADALIDHARYHVARSADLGSTPQADQERRQAWELYGEIALLESATLEQRRTSLQTAVDLMPSIPPRAATAWLETLFADDAIAPAALEAVAIKAMSIEDAKTPIEQRAQAILTMKDAVDVLLQSGDVDVETLRVPLRMLTMSLVSAIEETVGKHAGKRGVRPETALLFRSLPGPTWRSTIEPSLAIRAYKAFIGIAHTADDSDRALDLLEDGVTRHAAAAEELADEFLRLWILRLNPPPDPRANQNMFIIYGGPPRAPSAPLTRGRQRRNLDRLTRLLDVMESISIDGRQLERLVDAFAACHGRAEAFQRDNMVRALGPIENLAPAVASGIAESMRTGLNGDWRSRDVQRQEGSKRTKREVDEMVRRGYELAIDLIEHAIASDPTPETSWQHTMTRTALSYDFMQFQGEREQDAAAYQEARADLFRSFAAAARGYQDALAAGTVRANPGIYLTWFGISMGSSDLAGLKVSDLQTEAAENGAQFDAIREVMQSMEPDAAQFHLGEFARGIMSAVPRLTPEVKSGVVERAARVVGDHPAGAPLRRMLDLYDDLLTDEIRVRLTIDGTDRVGQEPFGVLLSLRYTASIDREVGGFDQYLRNNVWMALGGQYQTVNLRDRLEKSIEQAFSGDLELVSIGFFEAMNPARAISVDGNAGWEEKPIAYLVARATDESVDHLPALTMDLNLNDSTGPVVLPVRSNTPLIDATNASLVSDDSARPLHDVQAQQLVDLRTLRDGEDGPVRVEITAVGRGVLSELNELVDGLDGAMSGYDLAGATIEADPIVVAGVEAEGADIWMPMSDTEAKESYVEADDDGLFRLATSRRWTVTWDNAGQTSSDHFVLPTLAAGVDGSLRSTQFIDLDVVDVDGDRLAISPASNAIWWFIGIAVALSAIAIGLFLRGRQAGDADDQSGVVAMPAKLTPISAITTLARIRDEFGVKLSSQDQAALATDIQAVEERYFAANNTPGDDLNQTVRRWVGAVRVMACAAVLGSAALINENAIATNMVAADGKETWHSVQVTNDVAIDYVIVGLPSADSAGEKPVVPVLFAFPPGPQTREMVEAGLDRYWRALAREGDWVVVSPVAPADTLFFRGSEVHFPALMADVRTRLASSISVENDRMHLAGVSNGGRSSFRVAGLYPDNFCSMTVLPGFPPEEVDYERLPAISMMPIASFAGGDDRAIWIDSAERTAGMLDSLGADHSLVIYPGEGHVPASLDAEEMVKHMAGMRAEAGVRAVLDSFHAAASNADYDAYFNLMTDDGIFIGTDPNERWTKSEFQSYAKPIFDRGTGWTYTPVRRAVILEPTGVTATFDEDLTHERYGGCRGTGTMRLTDDGWKVVAYVLTFPIPNDDAEAVFKVIAADVGEGR